MKGANVKEAGRCCWRAAWVVLLCAAPWIGRGSAAEQHDLSLAEAQPLQSAEVTATGRVVALRSVRIIPRLSAHIQEWGRGKDGQPLDAGMAVEQGDVLFRMETTTFQTRVNAAQAVLDSANAALNNLVAPARPERLAVLEATVAELDARIKEAQRDLERFQRLVNDDKTMPVKRLEEQTLLLETLTAQRRGAQARLDEARKGPTETEIAVARARVAEAGVALAAARQDLNDTTVRAPFAGVITKRFKMVGDFAANMPPTEILELTALSELEAELRLPEAYLTQVSAVATRLHLRSPLLAEELALPVARVIPEIDLSQGSFVFRARIPAEKRGSLVPGAFITARLTLEPQGALVPLQALQVEAGQARVFVAEGGVMKRRAIELGDRLSEGAIVRSGLHAGEKVLLGPPSRLQDGAPLPAYLLPEQK